jgi:hypothetical protein
MQIFWLHVAVCGWMKNFFHLRTPAFRHDRHKSLPWGHIRVQSSVCLQKTLGVEVFTQCLPGSHRSHFTTVIWWNLSVDTSAVPGDVQVSQQWGEGRHTWVEGVGGFINSWHSLPGALIDPRLWSGMLSHLPQWGFRISRLNVAVWALLSSFFISSSVCMLSNLVSTPFRFV